MAGNSTMRANDWLQLTILSVLWGGSFFFNAVAVAELPVLVVVVGRVLIAALILNVIVRASGLRMPMDRASWSMFFVMGFLNNVLPFCLIVWGQSRIPSGFASILNASTPLFTVILAHLLTADEKMSGAKVFGVLAGFVGVAVMLGADPAGFFSGDLWAELACLAAAICYGLSSIYGRRFRRLGFQPLHVAAGQVSASSIILIPVMLAFDHPWTLSMPSTQAILALVGVAALSTALAYVLFFRLLASAGPTNVQLVTFLIPVSAIVLGSLFLGETLAIRHFAGMMMIGIGLAAIDGRLWAKIKTIRAGGANVS